MRRTVDVQLVAARVRDRRHVGDAEHFVLRGVDDQRAAGRSGEAGEVARDVLRLAHETAVGQLQRRTDAARQRALHPDVLTEGDCDVAQMKPKIGGDEVRRLATRSELEVEEGPTRRLLGGGG